MTPLLKSLSEEKIVLVKSGERAKMPFPIKGIIRMVDPKGRTVAIVLGPEYLAELEEDTESSSPAFLETLGRSRSSGRVCSKEVKYKAGIPHKK